MLISEFIDLLKEESEKHGNIPVAREDDGQIVEFDNLTQFTVENGLLIIN